MDERKCTKCEQVMSIDLFAWKNKASGIRQHHCRGCVSAKSREWYQTNSQKHIDGAKRNGKAKRKLNRDYIASLELKCAECSETHPAVLDFHHVDATTKDRNVADLVGSGMSQQRIEEEIKKCVVLCSNCHRKLHWNMRQ